MTTTHEMARTRKPPKPGVMSVDTETLIRNLLATEADETVSYATMAAWLGRSGDMDSWRHSLDSARRHLMNHHRVVFEAVVGYGIRRLTDGQIVGVVSGDSRKIGRAARRAIKKLACAEYEKLSDEEKRHHNARASHLGVLEMVMRPKALRQIEERCSQTGQKLPTGATLRLFGVGDPGD